ncbi:hypothetical protein FISHEDRAFT_43017, partial [Fistulina hepatica ATCC 64428]
KKVADRPKTKAHLKLCREAMVRHQNVSPSDEAIWVSLSDKDFTNKQNTFLWKAMHDAYKTGAFWNHIPNFEGRGVCPECGVMEDLKHILFECKIPGQKLVWELAKSLVEMKDVLWPNLSLGLVMAIALLADQGNNNGSKAGNERLLKIIVAESVYLIWVLRCERQIEFADDKAKWRQDDYIRNLWVLAINARLSVDKLSTNRIKFGKAALREEVVLETWSGVLLNEDALPD